MNPLSGLPNHTRLILLFFIAFILIAIPLTSYILSKNQSATIAHLSPTPTPDPTANWKIFRSKISGFYFKYPSDWQIQSSVAQYFYGKTEIVQLFSVKPEREKNVYFCIDFREYSKDASLLSNYSVASLGTPKKSEEFGSATGKRFFINTYGSAGTSMQNRIYMLSKDSTTTLITTKDGRLLDVSGSFNCVQGDYHVVESMTGDFNSRDEVITAKRILKSFDF